jgi:hypothetical protein
MSKITTAKRAKGKIQVVECLSSRYKALSSNLNYRSINRVLKDVSHVLASVLHRTLSLRRQTPQNKRGTNDAAFSQRPKTPKPHRGPLVQVNIQGLKDQDSNIQVKRQKTH